MGACGVTWGFQLHRDTTSSPSGCRLQLKRQLWYHQEAPKQFAMQNAMLSAATAAAGMVGTAGAVAVVVLLVAAAGVAALVVAVAAAALVAAGAAGAMSGLAALSGRATLCRTGTEMAACLPACWGKRAEGPPWHEAAAASKRQQLQARGSSCKQQAAGAASKRACACAGRHVSA
jgi:hypothetical protein